MSKPDWFPDWVGQTCVIVASGPSAAEVPLDQARGQARFIAVNNSWRLAPWADILFGCDFAWWHSVQGMPGFAGLKLSTEDRAVMSGWGIEKVGLNKGDNRLELNIPGTVGWGGNSGFHALNLAVQFGCARIVLVGFDMRIDRGLHWHGPHVGGLNNPRESTVAIWRRALEDAAIVLRKRSVQVINASPISALEGFVKMRFEEALMRSDA